MSLQVYATAGEPGAGTRVELPNGEQLLDVLGGREEALAVQLQELFSAVSEAVQGSLTGEGTLKIEVSGSIDLKAKAGIKYLFFDVGGEAGSSTTMKVALETAIKPR